LALIANDLPTERIVRRFVDCDSDRPGVLLLDRVGVQKSVGELRVLDGGHRTPFLAEGRLHVPQVGQVVVFAGAPDERVASRVVRQEDFGFDVLEAEKGLAAVEIKSGDVPDAVHVPFVVGGVFRVARLQLRVEVEEAVFHFQVLVRVEDTKKFQNLNTRLINYKLFSAK